MAVFIDRRQLLATIGRGSIALAGGAALPPPAPFRAETAGQTLPPGTGTPRIGFVRVPLSNGIIPHAGETSMELYHKHPHDPREEIVQPEDIRLQTRLTMRNHREILDWAGLDWTSVVKLTRYQTRMDESPQIEEVLRGYFKTWWPPQTVYQVSGLSSPQARVEIDMWVVPSGTRLVVG